MQSVCVFCGSRTGDAPEYTEGARTLGRLLAEQGITLVYGGGSIGLMGEVATAAMAAGGRVVGVIPRFLDKMEVGHKGITDLILVDSMHQRKQKMEELSEGVIAMPGGWGTMEELTEMLTWSQLKLVDKPIGVLNLQGYYDAFLQFADHMMSQGFINADTRALLVDEREPERLLQCMQAYKPHREPRKMNRSET